MFSNRIALTAASVTAIPVGIGFIKSMPVLAVSRRNPLVDMVRTFKRTMANSSPHILSMRDCLKVTWVNAVTVAADFFNVVPLKACGWLASNYVMSQYRLALNADTPITIGVAVANEKHAAISSAWIDLRPKALFEGSMNGHRVTSGVMGRGASTSPLHSILALSARAIPA